MSALLPTFLEWCHTLWTELKHVCCCTALCRLFLKEGGLRIFDDPRLQVRCKVQLVCLSACCCSPACSTSNVMTNRHEAMQNAA